ERSGVVNIALEGIMLTGAFIGFAVALATHNLWLGVLAAIVAGMLIASLHAALSVSLLVDQIVSGMLINILAVGITGVFYRTFIESSTTIGPGTVPPWILPGLSAIPALGRIFFQNQFVTYAMLLAVVGVYFLIFKTKWGLRTRACGENPAAAETAGINVYFVRYANVIGSGALAGLGGAYFSLQQIGNFLPNMTGGRGFIALAACGGPSTPSPSSGVRVCIATDADGLAPHTFNQLAAAGARSAGALVQVIASHTASDYLANIQRCIANHSALVVAISQDMATAVASAAKLHATQRFALVDGIPVDEGGQRLDLDNVSDLLFKAQEPGYLVGALAGLLEKNKVGS